MTAASTIFCLLLSWPLQRTSTLPKSGRCWYLSMCVTNELVDLWKRISVLCSFILFLIPRYVSPKYALEQPPHGTLYTTLSLFSGPFSFLIISPIFKTGFFDQFKGRVSTDIGNMELWARGWSIYFSELTVSFKPQGKFFNSLYFEHPWAESAMTYFGCTPNTFHNTINKNVNHSNDTIDNLNQSSFHKPACQCQGHLRTESLSASAHILHCGKIRPWVVRPGFRCASADLQQSRYLHVAR